MTSAEGPAAECIQKLGGLTKGQIRWMYSNYDRSFLIEEDWDPSSIYAQQLGNLAQRKWSDLHPDCASVDILIAGVSGDQAGADRFFQDFLFEGDDETFDFERPHSLWTANLTQHGDFVGNNGAAITFVGLSHIVSPEVQSEVAVLLPVPIQGLQGQFLSPTDAAFGELAYPLARPLYLNLLDDEESLQKTRPFLEFGLSEEGTQMLKGAGFWTLHGYERVVMMTRAQTKLGVPMDDITSRCDFPGSQVLIAGSSTVFPVAQIWSEVYQVHCDTTFVVEGGGSSTGAGRVCGNLDRGEPVEIGDMSREWKDSEASTSNGYVYQCIKGDPTRSVIQLAVAIDGMAVATKRDGLAAKCIETIGGLSVDQVRQVGLFLSLPSLF